MPTPKIRSNAIKASTVVSTGVASTITRLVAYSAQTNSGRRNQPSPGARSVCTLTMKLIAVKIDEKPTTNTPQTASITYEFEYSVEYRSEEHTSELQSLMRISSAVFC